MIDKSQATLQDRQKSKEEQWEAGGWQVPNKGVPHPAPRANCASCRFVYSQPQTHLHCPVCDTETYVPCQLAGFQLYQQRALGEDAACLSGSSDAPALP